MGILTKPIYRCPTCKGFHWWWRPPDQWGPGEWLCTVCHPNPGEGRKMSKDQSTHRAYYLPDGSIAPSVTKVLGVVDKPGLLHWAWECGIQGKDYRVIRKHAFWLGTLTHHLIAYHLQGKKTGQLEYGQEELDKAEQLLARYQEWEHNHHLDPVMIETAMVSEKYGYGGTFDLFAELDGELVLIDFKTGNSLYESYYYQLAAYQRLLEEQGWPVARSILLRVDTDGVEEQSKPCLDTEFSIFMHCLSIYQLKGSE